MQRLSVRIITGLMAFVLGLLAWMVFVFASPAETLDTRERQFRSVRVDVPPPPPPPPAKPHRACNYRYN